MSRISIFLNTKQPEPSFFATATAFAQAKPSTGEVLGTLVQETFFGEGSLAQDIEAGNIRKQERRGDAINEIDWKESDSFRPGLTWHEGMTKQSAETLARLEDDRADRQIVMQKASGGQLAAGFGGALITGLFEPKNFASGAVLSLFTAGLGQAIPTIARLTRVNSIRKAAMRGATEGVVAAGLTEPSSLESSKIVQGDYTLANSLINFGLSATLGAGFGVGAKAIQLKGRARRLKEIKAGREAYRAESEAMAIKEFDTATAQTIQGRPIDVRAVKNVEISKARLGSALKLQNLEQKLTLEEGHAIPFAEKAVDFDNSDDFIQAIKTGEDRLLDETTIGEIAHSTQVSRKVDDLSVKLDELRAENKIDTPEFKRIQQERRDLKQSEPKPKKFTAKQEEKVLRDFYEEVQKTKGSKSNRLQRRIEDAKADSRREPDLDAIKATENKLASKTDSGAYDIKDSEEIARFLDENDFEDFTALERDLENIQDDITLMLEEGLLSKEEIDTISRLVEIEGESAVFDNALLSAQLCLTRG